MGKKGWSLPRAQPGLLFHEEINVEHGMQTAVPNICIQDGGCPKHSFPCPVPLAAPQPFRGFLSLPLCIIAEACIFSRTPSSGKALNPLQALHLQSFAGKCSDFGKLEAWPAVSHSG